jgi:hypothetical protein
MSCFKFFKNIFKEKDNVLPTVIEIKEQHKIIYNTSDIIKWEETRLNLQFLLLVVM